MKKVNIESLERKFVGNRPDVQRYVARVASLYEEIGRLESRNPNSEKARALREKIFGGMKIPKARRGEIIFLRGEFCVIAEPCIITDVQPVEDMRIIDYEIFAEDLKGNIRANLFDEVDRFSWRRELIYQSEFKRQYDLIQQALRIRGILE